MICVIDAGNTRLKWQLRPEDSVQAVAWQVEPDWRTPFVAALEGQKIKQFIIAAVADETRQAALDAVLAEHWPTQRRRWLKPKARCGGLVLGYADPLQLGVDRWCALLGARQHASNTDAIVVLAGTAITVDYLRADGQHRGGVILPSLAAMRAGLNALAPRLAAAWDQPGTVAEGGALAVDTAGALHLGARFMLASAVTQLIDGLSEAESRAPKILLSGGDAPILAEWLARPAEVVPSLVFDGERQAARHLR